MSSFSSLFIGMVCEALLSSSSKYNLVRLSVPSSSGWCVKPFNLYKFDRHKCHLSVPSSSGWCVKHCVVDQGGADPVVFQFPLHRDGV